jgi:hypothetical protein
MSYFERTKKILKSEWVTDVTGIMCEANVIFGAYDKLGCGVDKLACWGNRAFGTGLAYAGVAYLNSKIVDFSDKVFGIDRSKKGSKLRDVAICAQDAFYAGVITALCSYGIYNFSNHFLASNPKSPSEIFGMSIGAGLLGLANGVPAFYARDIFRDLVGKKECSRNLYPQFIKKQSSKVKKRLAGLMVAGSIGITAGIIELTPDISISDSFDNVHSAELRLEDRVE